MFSPGSALATSPCSPEELASRGDLSMTPQQPGCHSLGELLPLNFDTNAMAALTMLYRHLGAPTLWQNRVLVAASA